MDQNKVFHILNPSGQFRSFVRKLFKKIDRDLYAWVERSQHPTHLETIVEWAIRENKEAIVLWGGDGSFNRLVNEVVRIGALSRIKVALVPVGTANDFSRYMGLKKIKMIDGKLLLDPFIEKCVDIGVIETEFGKRLFMNNAGFGRKPHVIGKGLTHPLKDIKEFSEHKLQLEWKNESFHQFETIRAFFGIVFNAPFFNNGMHFDREISPDDGSLSGFFVPPQGQLSMLWKFVKSRFGGCLNDKGTFRIDGDYIDVESDIDLYPQVDGEKVTDIGVRNIKYSILKEKLKLIIFGES